MKDNFISTFNYTTPSLTQLLRGKVFKWTSINFLVISVFLFLISFYFLIEMQKEFVSQTAKAASISFRHQILSNDIKSAERQIRGAFQLKNSESIDILNSNWEPEYSLKNIAIKNNNSYCKNTDGVCINFLNLNFTKTLPIYFDENKKELKGYLSLTLLPYSKAYLLVFPFFLILILALSFQVLGLNRIFGNAISSVSSSLNVWAEHIQNNPKQSFNSIHAPFAELIPLSSSLSGLNKKIQSFEKVASHEAQFNLIRGIVHDLKSPISQLQKLTELYLLSYDNKNKKIELSDAMRRSLSRLSIFARQIKEFNPAKESLSETSIPLNLSNELRTYLLDIKKDQDYINKSIFIQEEIETSIFSNICKSDFFRITDNLIKNALQASLLNGKIKVELKSRKNLNTLKITDYGIGINEINKNIIFDLDFTTKPGIGTGLGLAIVKSLCEKNEAEISFSSTLNKTTFTVKFKK